MAAQPAGTAARPPQSPQSCEHTSLSTFFPACPTLAPADTITQPWSRTLPPTPTQPPTQPPHPTPNIIPPTRNTRRQAAVFWADAGSRRNPSEKQVRADAEKKRESVRRAAPAPLCRLLVSGCLLGRASKPVKKSPDRSTPTTDNTLQHRLSNTLAPIRVLKGLKRWMSSTYCQLHCTQTTTAVHCVSERGSYANAKHKQTMRKVNLHDTPIMRLMATILTGRLQPLITLCNIQLI